MARNSNKNVIEEFLKNINIYKENDRKLNNVRGELMQAVKEVIELLDDNESPSSRQEAIEVIERAKGRLQLSVTRTLNYLATIER